MITTVELREGKLLLSPAIIHGYNLQDGDLVEVALLRAFRRSGGVVDLEPSTPPEPQMPPGPTGEWEDIG